MHKKLLKRVKVLGKMFINALMDTILLAMVTCSFHIKKAG
jgi:hypothetical protein